MLQKTPTTIAFVPQREWKDEVPTKFEDGCGAAYSVEIGRYHGGGLYVNLVHCGSEIEFGFKSKAAADTFANFLAAAFAEAEAVQLAEDRKNREGA